VSGKFRKLVRTYWFVAGIGAVLGLAYVTPEAGHLLSEYGAKKAAVIAIFLMSGLTTPLRHLGEDVGRWRCHLLVQSFSFMLIPTALYLTSGWLPDGPVRYGVYLVAVLPTTTSSCVVFTTAAGGRSSCALLNAVGGNLIGIVLSPLLLGLAVGYGGTTDLHSVSKAVRALCWLVLLPFVLGGVCGYVLPQRAVARVKRIQPVAAQTCVLLLMFCAFADSLGDLADSFKSLWACFLYLAIAHVAILAAANAGTRMFRLPPDVAAAGVFCSTQKTLAMGMPLAISFFEGADVNIALVLLPLIFYHLFQLIVGGLLIPRWSRRIAQAGRP